jgi:ABC-2 type transport system ATP-binding protein
VEEICERLVIVKNGKKIEDTTMIGLLNRNSQNKIRIELSNDREDWIEHIKNLDYVKDVELTGNKLKVEVENIKVNKRMLLENALKHHVDIVKFEIANDTLEEIFLKMVVEK